MSKTDAPPKAADLSSEPQTVTEWAEGFTLSNEPTAAEAIIEELETMPVPNQDDSSQLEIQGTGVTRIKAGKYEVEATDLPDKPDHVDVRIFTIRNRFDAHIPVCDFPDSIGRYADHFGDDDVARFLSRPIVDKIVARLSEVK